MSSIKCPECGKKINNNDKVCNNCGFQLNSKKNKNSFYFLLGAIIFALIIIILVIILLFKPNSNNDNSENYIACFEKDNICVLEDEVKNLTYSSSYSDIDALIYLLDERILSKLYSDESKNAKKEADKTMDSLIKQYGSEKELVNAIKSYTNYNSIDDYKNSLILSYYYDKVVKDYAKKQISDKEIKDYYDNKLSKSVKASHILITPEITENMSDEEKEKSINQAYQEAENVIKQLNNGADFSTLAKKYSRDETTKDKGGNLGYINKEDVLDTMYDEILKLDINTYNDKPIKTEYGYQIFLRTSKEEKPALKDIKEDIISKLATELIDLDDKFSIKVLDEFRKENELKIYDKDLDLKYKDTINSQLSKNN